MPSIFSKNAIISGDVDFYCLACEDKLRTEDTVNAHIQKVVHRKNLDQKCFYVKDYENENIRKVNKVYYCEYCNVLLTSFLKIPIHVKHKDHEYNKLDDINVITSNKHAKWYENCIIVLDDLLVKENAWNGLIDNNCAYCNIEFDNEELHKMESTHILNLIQAQLLIGEKRSVYRKLDNHTFHCLTCNEVLPLPVESHFELDTHVERYIQCRKDKKALYDKKHKNISIIETPKKQMPNENLSEKDHIKTVHIEHVDRLCNTNKLYKNEELSKAKITDHEPENDNHNIPEIDSLEALISKLDLNDYIHFNEKGDPLCIFCEWDLSGPVDSVKVHLQTKHYQEIFKLHNQIVEQEKREKIHKKTLQSKRDVVATTAKRDNLKCENRLQQNDCTTILGDNGNETPMTNIQSTNKSDILSNVAEFQKHAITIDFVNENAMCNKCNTSIILEIEVIRNHIEQHSKSESMDCPSLSKPDGNVTDRTNLLTRPDFISKSEPETLNVATANTFTETSDQEKTEKDVFKFASKNHIYYNFSSNQAYCHICETQIPKGLTSMKEHVKGAKHTRNVPETSKTIKTSAVSQKPYRTKSLEDFIVSLCRMKNSFQELIIVNKKFCITPSSFHIITRVAERLRCHMCEKNFNITYVNHHLHSDCHESRLKNTPVVISDEAEFIRIPRDGIFHCGFCNLIMASWSNVQDHMKSSTHRYNKIQSGWILEESLPMIEVHQMREAIMKMDLLRILFNNI